MLNDVKVRIETFGLSSATEKKRRPVLLGIGIMLVVLVTFISLGLIELYSLGKRPLHSDVVPAAAPALKASEVIASIAELRRGEMQDRSTERWYLWIRTSLLSLALLATILYYVKWENGWAQRHADAEFNLQQFHLDINRANWIIESCLEWRKNTSSAIPSELLKSITHGLFDTAASKTEQVLHPADELASALLGSASKLKLQTPGGEVEFDKPGKIPQKSS